MPRKGKYTKKASIVTRSRQFVHGRYVWFKGLTRKQKLMVIGLPILTFLILVPLITYLALARDISDPDRLMNRNNTGVELLDRKGEVFYSTSAGNTSKRLPLDKIADEMEDALVSSEDKNFYKHSGVSIRGTIGAAYANVTQGDATAYGGSTLTQQLVKNTLLSSDKSFLRKYQEAVMAIAVDQKYSKDEILDMYLNSVYYGENAFGIEQAADTYFNKTPAELDLAESAMLTGVLPAPSAYSPISGDKQFAKDQQKRVLGRMLEDGKITTEEKNAAENQKLSYAKPKDGIDSIAPHFSEMVIAELNEEYGEETVNRSGYKVTTSLDRDWQVAANKIVSDQAELNAQSGGENAALVATDPKTGEIKALVGSADYDNEDFGKVNMAITPRQPGSSFKPIYVTEALKEELFTPASIIRDEATNFGGYKPENFDFAYRGDITLRNAISQSLNIPMVKIMEKLGEDEAIETANRMGIDTLDKDQDYGLSLALGSGEVKLTDMVGAYGAFANQGEKYDETLIQKIESKYNKVIFSQQRDSEEVQTAQASYLISKVLSDDTARAPTFGSKLNIPGHSVAVKTGSTDDNRDAWTIGYTPSVAIGVWVGNNDNTVMQAGGSSLAGPIWSQSMIDFLGNSEDEGFPQPDGISETSICVGTEKRATGGGSSNTFKEYFISGTTPTETCNAPRDEPKEEEKKEEEEPEEKPSDRDQDGILDKNDDCPNTPRGVEVDNNGCEVEEEEPVEPEEPIDTDGDGVADVNDTCPGTASGATVNASGCSQQQRGGSSDSQGNGSAGQTEPGVLPRR